MKSVIISLSLAMFFMWSCSPEQIEPKSDSPSFGASQGDPPQSVIWAYDNADSLVLAHGDDYPLDTTVDTVPHIAATADARLWLPADTNGNLTYPDVVFWIDGDDYDHYNGDTILLDSIDGWEYSSAEGYVMRRVSASDMGAFNSSWLVIDNVTNLPVIWVKYWRRRCLNPGSNEPCPCLPHLVGGGVCHMQIHADDCFIQVF